METKNKMVGIGFCKECLVRIFRDETYHKEDDKLICEDCIEDVKQ